MIKIKNFDKTFKVLKGKSAFDDSVKQRKETFDRCRILRINLGEDANKKEQLSCQLLEIYPGDCLYISIDEEDGRWLNIMINERRIELTTVLNQVLTCYNVADVQIA